MKNSHNIAAPEKATPNEVLDLSQMFESLRLEIKHTEKKIEQTALSDISERAELLLELTILESLLDRVIEKMKKYGVRIEIVAEL